MRTLSKLKSTPYEDLVGKKLGKWTILEIGEVENESRRCICQCECGKIQKNRCSNLINGNNPRQCRECSFKDVKIKYIEKLTKEFVGKKFGKWTVIKITGVKSRRMTCDCQCECGNIKNIEIKGIIYGKSTQCRACASEGINLKHGLSRIRKIGKMSTEYRIYHGIKKRCYKENESCFPHYGGRGIKMCDRWLESVENFVKDMGPRPSIKHSIDRIDVNGNYSPENCKWSTQKEQCMNKRKVTDMQNEIYELRNKLKEYQEKYG